MPNLDDLWFTWRGYDSRDLSEFTDLDGIKLIVRKYPSITSPRRRYMAYSVNGRNGNIYVPNETFENTTIKIDVFLYTDGQGVSNDKLRKFCKAVAIWLYGGETYDLQPGGYSIVTPPGYQKLQICEDYSYYLAYYTGPTNIENFLWRFGKATLEFSARPEHFTGGSDDYDRELYSGGAEVSWTIPLDAGATRPAKPVIALNRRYCYNHYIEIRNGSGKWLIHDLSEYDPNNYYLWIIVDSERMEWRLSNWDGHPYDDWSIPILNDGPLINQSVDVLGERQFPEISLNDGTFLGLQGGPNGTFVPAGFPDLVCIQGRRWTL